MKDDQNTGFDKHAEPLEKQVENFGRQIGKAAKKAARAGDFSDLKIILDTAKEEIKREIPRPQGPAGPVPPPRQPYYPPVNPRAGRRSRRTGAPPQPPRYAPQYRPTTPAYTPTVMKRPKSPRGSVSGVLLQIFGWSAAAFIPLLAFAFAAVLEPLFAFAFTGAWAAGSVWMIARGKQLHGRAGRCLRYSAIMRGRRYCAVDEIASQVGRSREYTAKDIRKMIWLGMFPGAHIDEQGTCIMLDEETYRQYLKAMESRKQRELEESRQREQQAEHDGGQAANGAVEAAVREGKDYLRRIREVNDAIPEVSISNKLFRLEEITSKIFNFVEQHPNKLDEIHKFMQYYLPTTLKLLQSYCEFCQQPVQGENIAKAKSEIEDALDTINVAFENLLDSLFQDEAFDVSTDIAALEVMLAQEGLTGRDFEVGGEPGGKPE